MKKILSLMTVGLIALGLTSCSTGDASEKRQADTQKAVTTPDEAWEQLDELNYSFSKVGSTEWTETSSPMLVQCGIDANKVQILTTKRGIFAETEKKDEVAKEIAAILKRSGLDTSVEDTKLDENEEASNLTTIYSSNEEQISLTITLDDARYMDLISYSKCVDGTVDTPWHAPGRAPILPNDNQDDIQVIEEGTDPAVEESLEEETTPEG